MAADHSMVNPIMTKITMVLISISVLLPVHVRGQLPMPSSDQRIDMAKSQRLTGHYDDAAKTLSAVLASQPDNFRAVYNLGLLQAQQGDVDSAISTLSRAASIREKTSTPDYTIYNTLGWLQMKKGDYKDAEETFEKGIAHKDELSPGSRSLLENNLGVLYLSQGRPELAEPLFNEAKDLGHKSAPANLEIAQSLNRYKVATETKLRERQAQKSN
jgi:Flp pilus assembly protein TadD